MVGAQKIFIGSLEKRKEKEKEERKNGVWRYYFSLIFQKLGEQLLKS